MPSAFGTPRVLAATRLVLAVLSGLLVFEAHTGCAWAGLVALAPLFVALELGDDVSFGERALLGGLVYVVPAAHMWGLMHYGSSIYWASFGYLAATGAAFALMAWPCLGLQSAGLRGAGLVSAWTLGEGLRAFSDASFPALLGGTVADVPPLAPLAALGGPWVSTAALATVGFVVAQGVMALVGWRAPSVRGMVGAFAALAVVGAMSAIVAGLLFSDVSAPRVVELEGQEVGPDELDVVVLQGAVPVWMHRNAWDFERLQDAIDASYLGLFDEAIEAAEKGGRAPDLIVFPETATGRRFGPGEPGDAEVAAYLGGRVWPAQTGVVFSATRTLPTRSASQPDREDASMLLSWAAGAIRGRVAAQSEKRQMTPIAEPMYAPGSAWTPLKAPTCSAGVMVCWESLYPRVGLELVDGGADLLLVLTNDSGQRWSKAGPFHARLSKMRALESGRSLVFASQAGPSLAVSPTGASVDLTHLFERRAARVVVPRADIATPYRVLGRTWLLLPFGLWLGLVFRVRRVGARPDRARAQPP